MINQLTENKPLDNQLIFRQKFKFAALPRFNDIDDLMLGNYDKICDSQQSKITEWKNVSTFYPPCLCGFDATYLP